MNRDVTLVVLGNCTIRRHGTPSPLHVLVYSRLVWRISEVLLVGHLSKELLFLSEVILLRVARKILTLIFRSLKRDYVTLSNRRVVQILRVCWAHRRIILPDLNYLARADEIWLGWLHWALLCTVVIDSFDLIRSNDEAATSARAFGLASVAQDLDIVGVDSHTLALFVNCLIPHVRVGCGILCALMPLVSVLLIVMLVFLRERLDVLILFY
jgi:hypothetical protein